jgi:hypothetical protein
VLTHLARNVSKNLVPVGQLHSEHRVGKGFDYRTFDFDDTVFVGHGLACLAGKFSTGRAGVAGSKAVDTPKQHLTAFIQAAQVALNRNSASGEFLHDSAGDLINRSDAVDRH